MNSKFKQLFLTTSDSNDPHHLSASYIKFAMDSIFFIVICRMYEYRNSNPTNDMVSVNAYKPDMPEWYARV